MKRSPLRHRKKQPYKTDDLLKEVQYLNIFYPIKKKRLPLNTGDRIDIFDCMLAAISEIRH
jgi:hypothetical protein